jgi:hypothetical protein
MLKFDSKPAARKLAIALIVINLLRISTPFITYFQTKYQLDSPLIPKEIVLDIIAPYMMIGFVSLIFTIAAFIFFIYSKFTFTTILCLLNLVFVQLYFIYFPYIG